MYESFFPVKPAAGTVENKQESNKDPKEDQFDPNDPYCGEFRNRILNYVNTFTFAQPPGPEE